jgi:hypothetical protein
MILFDLRCANGHGFEAWFRDSATYDHQVAAGEISCAICGSTEVSKALMAPAVASGPRIDDQQAAQHAAKVLGKWREVQRHIETNFDHVGRQFPEEARKMHYGEIEKRGIYGEATRAEAKELVDEGVKVGQIPWLPPHDG